MAAAAKKKRISRGERLIQEFQREEARNRLTGHAEFAERIRTVVLPKLRELVDGRVSYADAEKMIDDVELVGEYGSRTPDQDALHWAICSYMGNLCK